MKTIEAPTAYLDWSLIVECPKCKLDVDIAVIDSDDAGIISNHVFNNNWELLQGFYVDCPHCKHGFQIKGVEY